MLSTLQEKNVVFQLVSMSSDTVCKSTVYNKTVDRMRHYDRHLSVTPQGTVKCSKYIV